MTRRHRGKTYCMKKLTKLKKGYPVNIRYPNLGMADRIGQSTIRSIIRVLNQKFQCSPKIGYQEVMYQKIILNLKAKRKRENEKNNSEKLSKIESIGFPATWFLAASPIRLLFSLIFAHREACRPDSVEKKILHIPVIC